MSESSVHRTPVEIWHHILGFAVQSPFLPGWNDGILGAIAVLSSGCKADAVARSAHDRVETVRLVCRSWNAAVKTIRPPVLVVSITPPNIKNTPPHVNLSPSEKVLLQARRLEILGQSDRCSCSMPLCRYSLGASLRRFSRAFRDSLPKRFNGTYVEKPAGNEEPSDRRSNFAPNSKLKGLTAFIMQQKAPGMAIEAFLDPMMSLEALSWEFSPSAAHFHALVQHPVHENLSYLKMNFNWGFLTDLTAPIVFPRLRHLQLLCNEKVSALEPSGNYNLVTWARFPALSSMVLSGDMDHNRHEEVLMLLGSCGSTLSSLLLNIAWRSGPEINFTFKITSHLWDCLPILRNFGPGVDALIQRTPSPKHASIPISILLSTIPPNESINPAAKKPTDCLNSFFRICRKWKTREVFLVESWKQATHSAEDQLRRAMVWAVKTKETYHLSRDPSLYKLLTTRGIAIYDSNRIPITHKDGDEFLKMLRYCKCCGSQLSRVSESTRVRLSD